MLVYIIDGFNLTHKITALKNSNTPHRDLLRYIKANKLTGSKNNRVTVVFDGGISFDVRQKEGNFTVIFSLDKTADELIVKLVNREKNKSEVIVVSDDRQIRDSIRIEGARSCRIAEFIAAKKEKQIEEKTKEISYTLQKEITDELRKVWLSDKK